MTFLKGLQGLKDYQEKNAAPQYEEREKVEYVKWPRPKKAGDPVTLRGRFLNEIDESSPHYDPEAGLAVIVVEHQGPGKEGYKRRAECTVEEDENGVPHNCIPCERRWKANQDKTEDWKNWRKGNPRMYLNFAYINEEGEEVVGVYNAPVEGQNIISTLLAYAEDGGSITNREFKITRSGTGTDTKYVAVALKEEDFEKKASEYELQNIAAAPLKVKYEQQARFYDSTPGWTPQGTADSGSEDDSDEKESKPGFAGW